MKAKEFARELHRGPLEWVGLKVIESPCVPKGDAYLVPADFLQSLPMHEGETVQDFVRRLLRDPALARKVALIRGLSESREEGEARG